MCVYKDRGLHVVVCIYVCMSLGKCSDMHIFINRVFSPTFSSLFILSAENKISLLDAFDCNVAFEHFAERDLSDSINLPLRLQTIVAKKPCWITFLSRYIDQILQAKLNFPPYPLIFPRFCLLTFPAVFPPLELFISLRVSLSISHASPLSQTYSSLTTTSRHITSFVTIIR